jgi:membrane protease YdiL (CAAX protease family)
MIQDVLKEFLSYIKKPNPLIKTEPSAVFFNQLFPLVIIALSFAFAATIFTSTLEQLHIVRKLPEFDLFDLKERKFLLFLMIVVAAPLFEEFIFRLQLKEYSLALLFYFGLAVFYLNKIFTDSTLFILVFVALILAILVFQYLWKNKTRRIKLIKRYFPYHFYSTAIIFGLVHISNYDNPFKFGLPIVLLILPQLFVGFILGYVRMRFGISKSIIMHAAYNFIPALGLLAGY